MASPATASSSLAATATVAVQGAAAAAAAAAAPASQQQQPPQHLPPPLLLLASRGGGGGGGGSPAVVAAGMAAAAGSGVGNASGSGVDDSCVEELFYVGNGNSDEDDSAVAVEDDENGEGDNFHTARASAHALKVFADFVRRTGLGADADAFTSSTELAAALEAFYVSGLTRRDGEPYKPNSVFLFRGGLKRHYANRLGVDIVHDLEFRTANDAFFARLKEIRLQGKGAVNHIPAITPDDLDRLYRSSVFDDTDPKRLQWKVYFDIMIYLYERGNNMHGMDKFSLVQATDSLGRRYLRYSCTPGEQEKRMYELPGDPLCPVLSYEKYLSHLHPDCDFLWQRPRKTAALAAAAMRALPPPLCAWYDPHPIGFTSLKGVMALISQAAGLSRIYSATSILATSSAQLFHLRASMLDEAVATVAADGSSAAHPADADYEDDMAVMPAAYATVSGGGRRQLQTHHQLLVSLSQSQPGRYQRASVAGVPMNHESAVLVSRSLPGSALPPQQQQQQQHHHHQQQQQQPPAGIAMMVKREREWTPEEIAPVAASASPHLGPSSESFSSASTAACISGPSAKRYRNNVGAGSNKGLMTSRGEDLSRGGGGMWIEVASASFGSGRSSDGSSVRSDDGTPAASRATAAVLDATPATRVGGSSSGVVAAQVRGSSSSGANQFDGRTPPPAVTTSSDDGAAGNSGCSGGTRLSPREALERFVRAGQLFCCAHCDMYFAERSDYFLHRGLHLSESSPWQCSVCRRAFDGKNEFSLHIVNHIHRP